MFIRRIIEMKELNITNLLNVLDQMKVWCLETSEGKINLSKKLHSTFRPFL